MTDYTSAQRDEMLARIKELRRQRDTGEISKRQFKRSEYGRLCQALWGKDFFARARGNVEDPKQSDRAA